MASTLLSAVRVTKVASFPYLPPKPLSVTPSMKYFWKRTKIKSTGNIDIVAKAMR
jgi:hypothetical protein